MPDPALRPIDVIDGASIKGRKGLYVLGCFDQRITFYSQQVRGLALIHALAEQDYLREKPRVAVIGGGAAGLAAAAAAALASDSEVVLFEAADDLLKLQMGTDRRKLDPHIYNWPRSGADDPVADLPILDWEAGPSSNVRDDVVRQFEDVAGRRGNLVVLKRHRVTGARELDAGGYELTVFDKAAGRLRTEAFQIVILAFGFGLEASETVHGIGDKSYWDNAGIPGAEFRGRANPHYFVSGSGDGGLIDFVAAASKDFDHAAMIQAVTSYPNMEPVKTELLAIETEARHAKVLGDPFNLFEAFSDRIGPLIQANGLVTHLARQLRPGVQMTLQTRDESVFTLGSSILNRLAVVATIIACQTTEGHGFNHLTCENFSRVAGYKPAADEPTYKLNCDGQIVTADEVIVRRGTDRDSVRQPFSDLLTGYEAQHCDWLDRLGEATLIPKLSNDAQDFFRDLARSAHVAGSRRRIALAQAAMPMIVHLSAVGEEIRWAGAHNPDRIAEAWDDGSAFDATLAQGPEALGSIAGAILRVAVHAPQATVHATPLDWLEPWRQLTAMSPYGGGILMPKLVGDNPGGGAQIRIATGGARLATMVHRALDKWLLARIDAHLTSFFLTGEDQGAYVDLEIHSSLRNLMRGTWTTWREAFTDDSALLGRFLRLVVSASDDDGDAVQVLVGRSKLKQIIGGTALSLAIAAVWGQTSPRGMRPGNLLRQLAGNEHTGHGCAPDRILGKRPSLSADTHNWQTSFVLLALEGSLDLARKAEAPFAIVEAGQPSLAETTGSGPMMMWISQEFIDALAGGVGALKALIEEVERQYTLPMLEAIERLGETT
ncbi:ABC-three component system protein [Mesorhizobium sp.]|uniref:ABC-three component system protein n=2 Tax=Mesorhizobium sp. TaxID=1871066 RepID=UPI00258002CF|nr:ABC-three component system protein [Mesorhizobium sp.]